MQTLTAEDKKRFCAKRFMDDILLIYADDGRWDTQHFIRDFERSECYQRPLRLEAGREDTFLETRFVVTEENKVHYRLKNDNEQADGDVWRYQHWDSHTTPQRKRATLVAALRKAQTMASTRINLIGAALAKAAEFRRLRYPLYTLQKACSQLGATTGEGAWITVREILREQWVRSKGRGMDAN